jgi:catalase-peroxidase
MRGGANGARVRLAPQKDWEANAPEELARVLNTLGEVQQDFNKSLSGGKQVSLADVIVLGGVAAIEKAAKEAGHSIEVPFMPGRSDASQEMTDVNSFAVLEPTADAFRNYYSDASYGSPAKMLVEKADLLTNLLDMSTKWTKSETAEGIFEGRDRATDKLKWTATPVDLVFGSNSELRAVAEAYAAADGSEQFVKDFVAAWTRVMSLDRFDLK